MPGFVKSCKGFRACKLTNFLSAAIELPNKFPAVRTVHKLGLVMSGPLGLAKSSASLGLAKLMQGVVFFWILPSTK